MHTGLPASDQEPEERATGGQIARPGADVNDDAVPAMLSPGFVITPDQARAAFGDELLSEINSGEPFPLAELHAALAAVLWADGPRTFSDQQLAEAAQLNVVVTRVPEEQSWRFEIRAPASLLERVSDDAIVEPGLVDDMANTGRVFMWPDEPDLDAPAAVLPDTWQDVPEPAPEGSYGELLRAAITTDGPSKPPLPGWAISEQFPPLAMLADEWERRGNPPLLISKWLPRPYGGTGG